MIHFQSTTSTHVLCWIYIWIWKRTHPRVGVPDFSESTFCGWLSSRLTATSSSSKSTIPCLMAVPVGCSLTPCPCTWETRKKWYYVIPYTGVWIKWDEKKNHILYKLHLCLAICCWMHAPFSLIRCSLDEYGWVCCIVRCFPCVRGSPTIQKNLCSQVKYNRTN